MAEGLTMDDVSRVYNQKGEIVYEATTGGKTKSQLTDIWNKAKTPETTQAVAKTSRAANLENIVKDTNTQAALAVLNKYAGKDVPVVNQGGTLTPEMRNIPTDQSLSWTSTALDNLNKLAANSDKWDLEDIAKERAKIISAGKNLYYNGLPPEIGDQSRLKDLLSFGDQLRTKSNLSTFTTPDALYDILGKSPLQLPDRAVPENADLSNMAVGEIPATGLAGSIGEGKAKENVARFNTALSNRSASNRVFIVDRPELEPFMRDVNNGMNKADIKDGTKKPMSNPQNNLQVFGAIDGAQGREFVPLGWVSRQFRINDSKFAFNKNYEGMVDRIYNTVKGAKNPDTLSGKLMSDKSGIQITTQEAQAAMDAVKTGNITPEDLVKMLHPATPLQKFDPNFNKDTIANSMRKNGLNILTANIGDIKPQTVTSGEPFLKLSIEPQHYVESAGLQKSVSQPSYSKENTTETMPELIAKVKTGLNARAISDTVAKIKSKVTGDASDYLRAANMPGLEMEMGMMTNVLDFWGKALTSTDPSQFMEKINGEYGNILDANSAKSILDNKANFTVKDLVKLLQDSVGSGKATPGTKLLIDEFIRPFAQSPQYQNSDLRKVFGSLAVAGPETLKTSQVNTTITQDTKQPNNDLQSRLKRRDQIDTELSGLDRIDRGRGLTEQENNRVSALNKERKGLITPDENYKLATDALNKVNKNSPESTTQPETPVTNPEPINPLASAISSKSQEPDINTQDNTPKEPIPRSVKQDIPQKPTDTKISNPKQQRIDSIKAELELRGNDILQEVETGHGSEFSRQGYIKKLNDFINNLNVDVQNKGVPKDLQIGQVEYGKIKQSVVDQLKSRAEQLVENKFNPMNEIKSGLLDPKIDSLPTDEEKVSAIKQDNRRLLGIRDNETTDKPKEKMVPRDRSGIENINIKSFADTIRKNASTMPKESYGYGYSKMLDEGLKKLFGSDYDKTKSFTIDGKKISYNSLDPYFSSSSAKGKYFWNNLYKMANDNGHAMSQPKRLQVDFVNARRVRGMDMTPEEKTSMLADRRKELANDLSVAGSPIEDPELAREIGENDLKVRTESQSEKKNFKDMTRLDQLSPGRIVSELGAKTGALDGAQDARAFLAELVSRFNQNVDFENKTYNSKKKKIDSTDLKPIEESIKSDAMEASAKKASAALANPPKNDVKLLESPTAKLSQESKDWLRNRYPNLFPQND